MASPVHDSVVGMHISVNVAFTRTELAQRAAAAGLPEAAAEQILATVGLTDELEKKWVDLANVIRSHYTDRLAMLAKEAELKGLILLGFKPAQQLAYADNVPRKPKKIVGVEAEEKEKANAARRAPHQAAMNKMRTMLRRLIDLTHPAVKAKPSAAVLADAEEKKVAAKRKAEDACADAAAEGGGV